MRQIRIKELEKLNLFKDVKLTKIAAGAVTATTDVDSSVIDMSGYDGVVFFGSIATANAGNFIKAQQGTDATVTDAADLAGSKVVAAANNQVVWVEIHKPLERYLRAKIVRAGVTTVTGDLYALQYSGRVRPETNLVANALIGTLLISPAEGTA